MLSDVDEVLWMSSVCISIIILCLNDVKLCIKGIILMVHSQLFINDFDLANPCYNVIINDEYLLSFLKVHF